MYQQSLFSSARTKSYYLCIHLMLLLLFSKRRRYVYMHSIRYRCAGTSSFIVSEYDPASVPSCTDWLWQQKQLNETVSFSLDWSSSIGPQHNAARVALGRRSAPLLLIDQYLPHTVDRLSTGQTDGQTDGRTDTVPLHRHSPLSGLLQ